MSKHAPQTPDARVRWPDRGHAHTRQPRPRPAGPTAGAPEPPVCHPPTTPNRSRPCRIGQASGRISPPPNCARKCHVVPEPIAHSIAHSHPPTLKTAPRPLESPLKEVGPAGLEDAGRGCARSCRVASGCAYLCHAAPVAAAFGRCDRATLCQAVSGSDRGHCTLRCTLGA